MFKIYGSVTLNVLSPHFPPTRGAVSEFTTTGIHRVKAVLLSGYVIGAEDRQEKPTATATEAPIAAALRFSARLTTTAIYRQLCFGDLLRLRSRPDTCCFSPVFRATAACHSVSSATVPGILLHIVACTEHFLP